VPRDPATIERWIENEKGRAESQMAASIQKK